MFWSKKKAFEIEEPAEEFGNLYMSQYFAHGGSAAVGLEWDSIDLPGEALMHAFIGSLTKFIEDGALDPTPQGKKKNRNKSNGVVGPGDENYHVALAKEAFEWSQLNLGFRRSDQTIRKHFVDGTPISEIPGKKNQEAVKLALLTASKKMIGHNMGILALIAAVWYREEGHGSLVVEVDSWANFANPNAKEKCNLWLQWVPEKHYADFPGDFGSDGFLKTVKANSAAAFNVVPRDSTGYSWNGLNIPHFPELLELPQFKSFVDQISTSGKRTLGFNTMGLTSAVLISRADVLVDKDGNHTVSRSTQALARGQSTLVRNCVGLFLVFAIIFWGTYAEGNVYDIFARILANKVN